MTVKEPDYGSGSRAITITSPNNVKYIRITDFDDEGIKPDHEFVTAEVIDDKYTLHDEDILFARSGATAGKTFIYKPDLGRAIFAGYCIRFQFDKTKILPEFVYFYTKTQRYQTWVNSIQRPSGQPNINKEEFKSFTIPLPPLDIQKSLVAEIEAARQSRKQKLAQADELLSSLDGYLLDQLGLSAPEESDKKVFSVRLCDVKTRFDVDYHSLRFRNLRRMLEGNSSYPVMTIGEICQKTPRSGFAAGRQDQAFNDDEGFPHIRPLNIKPFGEIIFEGTKYVPKESVKKEDFLVNNEVLFNNTNSMEWVGKSAVFIGDKKCACSNHVTRLLLKEDIAVFSRMRGNKILERLTVQDSNTPHSCDYRYIAEPLFLVSLFNSLRSLGFLGILSTNFNNQAGINIETLSSLRIPVPSLSEQKFVISEIYKRREQGQKLRQEAETEWETAKTRFEQKLVGEEM